MKNEKDWWHRLSSILNRLTRSASGLVILAAIFYALTTINDNYVMNNAVNHEDSWIATSAYLVICGWLITLGTLIFNCLVALKERITKQVSSNPDKSSKKKPNEKYLGFELGTSRMQIYTIFAGMFAAFNMVFLLEAYQNLDPSLVLALTVVGIVYLIIYDLLRRENRKEILNKFVGISAFLIIIGALITCLVNISGEITLDPLAIIYVVFLANIFWAFDNVVRYRYKGDSIQKNSKIPNKNSREPDKKTFIFWRAFWLSALGTIFISVLALWRGNFVELWSFIANIWTNVAPLALRTVILVYAFQLPYQQALDMGTEKISKITMRLMLQIIFGVIISGIIVYLFDPLAFGKQFPIDPTTWTFRFIGMSVLIIGIVLTRKHRLARDML